MDGKASLEHTIHTIAVVGRVKWRPERTYQIASCALVVDYSIHVWDIRRPYIPYASFNEHTNVTTDIAWKGDNSHILLSTSKDSTIYKHAFKDAVRPSLKTNAQSASLGRRGDISFAYKIKLPHSELKPQQSDSRLQAAKNIYFNNSSSRLRSGSNEDQFHLAKSEICQFRLMPYQTGYVNNEDVVQLKEHDGFIGCAKELILTGRKLSDICEHNATITKKYGKHNATTLWKFIKVLYGSNEFSKQRYEPRSSFSNQKNAQSSRRPTQIANVLAHDSLQWDHNDPNDDNNNDDDADQTVQDIDSSSGMNVGCNSGSKQNYPPFGSVILSETQILNEITFDNFDLLRDGFIYVGPPDFAKALSFPETALHHDVQAARPPMELKAESKEKSPPPNVTNVLKVSNIPTVPMWEPHKFIVESIMLQSDVGEVQTAISILIAMGEARKLLQLDDTLIEHWFQKYIDQLHRYQLWNEACKIINLSWLRSVRELNQQSTAVRTNCGDCGRLIGESTIMQGWYCQKCKSMQSSKCSVCCLVVRGLYAWCQGCSHGGHLEHIMEYFSNHSKCPKCGHLCEYN